MKLLIPDLAACCIQKCVYATILSNNIITILLNYGLVHNIGFHKLTATAFLCYFLNNGIAYISLAFFGDAAETTLRDLVGPNWLYWLIYALAAVVFAYAMVRLVQTIRDEKEVE